MLQAHEFTPLHSRLADRAGCMALWLRRRAGPAAYRGRDRDGRAATAAGGGRWRAAGTGLCLDRWLLGLGGRSPRMGTGALGGATAWTALGGASVDTAGGWVAAASRALGAWTLTALGGHRRLTRCGPIRCTTQVAEGCRVPRIEPVCDEPVGDRLMRRQQGHSARDLRAAEPSGVLQFLIMQIHRLREGVRRETQHQGRREGPWLRGESVAL